jgi:hypothetical protein
VYPRNAASPERIAVGAVVQISDGAVQTTGVTTTVRGQGGSEAGGGGTTAFGASGIGYYTPTQAETNFTSFVVILSKSGCIPVAQTIITTATITPGRVVLADAVTHGGTAAVLTLERAVVASTTSGQPGVSITGNGAGAGILVTGGLTGNGITVSAGATSGHGIISTATGTSFNGLRVVGSPITGEGLRVIGGSTSGAGARITTTLGHGIQVTAAGAASNALIMAAAAHVDVVSITSVGDANAIRLACSPGSNTIYSAGDIELFGTTKMFGDPALIIESTSGGAAVEIAGTGSSPALRIYGYDTGPGISIAGGNTSGNAIEIAPVDGHGVSIVAAGTDKHGIKVIGGGSGNGVNIVGGDTGSGMVITGGATSGHGIIATATGTSFNGLRVVGSPITGEGLRVLGGSTSGAGIRVSTTSGIGVELAATLGSALVATASVSQDVVSVTATGVGQAIRLGAAGSNAVYMDGSVEILGTDSALKLFSTNGPTVVIETISAGTAVEITGTGPTATTIVRNLSTGAGISIAGGTTSGDAVQIATTDGHGVNVVASGTGKHGITSTGSAAGVGIKASGTTTGPGMWITGGTPNATGLLIVGNGSGNGISVSGLDAIFANGVATGMYFQAASGVVFQGNTGPGIAAFGTDGAIILESVGASAAVVDIIHGSTGDGIKVTTTVGHGVNITAVGASKHGIVVTGGTSGVSDGIKAVAGTGGVDIRGDITGDITGDLSGSVGSVFGLDPALLDVAVSSRLAAADYVVPPSANAVRDAIFAKLLEGEVTFEEACTLWNAASAGKTDGFVPGSSGTGHLKNLADTKDRITATYDSDGNRTSITLDLT